MNYPVCLLFLLCTSLAAGACHKSQATSVPIDSAALHPPAVATPVPTTDTFLGNFFDLQPSCYSIPISLGGSDNDSDLTDANIILSAHIYPNGYNQAKGHTSQQADPDDLAAAGRPCIVGEFGNAPAGSADCSGMVSYARSKKWAVLRWAWNGDGGSMNMVSPAWDSVANATSYGQSSYFTVIYSLLSNDAQVFNI